MMSADLQIEDTDIESSIRPITLEEYIGQSAIKENLSIFIQAAELRNEAL